MLATMALTIALTAQPRTDGKVPEPGYTPMAGARVEMFTPPGGGYTAGDGRTGTIPVTDPVNRAIFRRWLLARDVEGLALAERDGAVRFITPPRKVLVIEAERFGEVKEHARLAVVRYLDSEDAATIRLIPAEFLTRFVDPPKPPPAPAKKKRRPIGR
jgi:hypothetical protein